MEGNYAVFCEIKAILERIAGKIANDATNIALVTYLVGAYGIIGTLPEKAFQSENI